MEMDGGIKKYLKGCWTEMKRLVRWFSAFKIQVQKSLDSRKRMILLFFESTIYSVRS